MEKENKKYVTFALPLIKQLYVAQPTIAIRQIELFAINRVALQYNVTVEDAVKEVIYDATTESNKMSPHIYSVLEGYQPMWGWVGQQIFNGGQIDLSLVEEEAEYVRSILTEQDEEEADDFFISDACLFAKRRRAAADLEMDVPKWGDWALIAPFTSLYENQVPVSISLERLEGWCLEREYDRVKLAVYLAVRSLAKDGVAITNLQAIKWRSMGCRNRQEFKQALRTKQLQAIVDKWHTRYYFPKILADLQASQLIIVLNRRRYIFVSASILDEDKFLEAAYDKLRCIKAKAKEKQASEQQKQMNAKWNAMLNNLTD